MRFLCPRFALYVHRFGEATNAFRNDKWNRPKNFIHRVIFHTLRYFSVVVCKIFFQEGAVIGKNVRLSNKGNIIVGASQIGEGCVIHHNVTFGLHLANNKNFKGKPRIGSGVWVGPDTILHGNINIGNKVTILCGTVLTKSIPDRCVVGGNPGRILYRDFDNSRLLNFSSNDVTLQTIKEMNTEDDR